MRHLNKGTERPQRYETDICFWDQRTESQSLQTCYFLFPHEIFDYEVGKHGIEIFSSTRENPFLQTTFEAWCGFVGLNSSDPDILAFGLWGDSAVISHSETLFILLINCLSGINRRRHCVVAVGKKMVCQCGCSGRHTFDTVFKVIQ